MNALLDSMRYPLAHVVPMSAKEQRVMIKRGKRVHGGDRRSQAYRQARWQEMRA
jgi:hypothetical protein